MAKPKITGHSIGPPKPKPITYKGAPIRSGLATGALKGGLVNGGAPAPATPTPATPGGAAPTPDYRDSQYFTDVGNAQRQHDLNQSQYQQQRFTTQTDYGLDAGFNDPTANPFSRAALLQRTYDQNKNKTLNSYAAQGQLYSGSLGNAQGYDAFNNQQGYDALSKQYQSAIQGLTNQGNQSNLDLDMAIANASAQALGRRVSQAPDPSEAAAPDTSGDDLNARLLNFNKKKPKKKK